MMQIMCLYDIVTEKQVWNCSKKGYNPLYFFSNSGRVGIFQFDKQAEKVKIKKKIKKRKKKLLGAYEIFYAENIKANSLDTVIFFL